MQNNLEIFNKIVNEFNLKAQENTEENMVTPYITLQPYTLTKVEDNQKYKKLIGDIGYGNNLLHVSEINLSNDEKIIIVHIWWDRDRTNIIRPDGNRVYFIYIDKNLNILNKESSPTFYF